MKLPMDSLVRDLLFFGKRYGGHECLKRGLNKLIFFYYLLIF